MNTQPTWFRKVPAIIEALEKSSIELLDRQECETLFDLKRTAAGDLLNRMGATRVGNSLTITRRHLLRMLRKTLDSPECYRAVHRARRVRDEIEKARQQRRVMIQPRPELAGVGLDALPWLHFLDGQCIIDHDGPEDLLEKYRALGSAIGRDLDQFLVIAHRAQR